MDATIFKFGTSHTGLAFHEEVFRMLLTKKARKEKFHFNYAREVELLSVNLVILERVHITFVM